MNLVVLVRDNGQALRVTATTDEGKTVKTYPFNGLVLTPKPAPTE